MKPTASRYPEALSRPQPIESPTAGHLSARMRLHAGSPDGASDSKARRLPKNSQPRRLPRDGLLSGVRVGSSWESILVWLLSMR